MPGKCIEPENRERERFKQLKAVHLGTGCEREREREREERESIAPVTNFRLSRNSNLSQLNKSKLLLRIHNFNIYQEDATRKKERELTSTVRQVNYGKNWDTQEHV